MKISYKDVDEGQRYKVFGTKNIDIDGDINYSWREAGHTLYDMFYGNYGKEEFNPFISTDLYKM